jgi:hypothetical protein
VTRIQLIEGRADVGEEQYGEIDAIAAGLGSIGGPYSVLLKRPGLAGKVFAAGSQLRVQGLLTPAERELAILAVARERDTTFVWSTHVHLARKAGVPEPTIEAVGNRSELDAVPSQERSIVEFVQALLRTNRVPTLLFDSLIAERGEDWVIDLTATVGQILYIGAVLNVFEVDAPEGGAPLPG